MNRSVSGRSNKSAQGSSSGRSFPRFSFGLRSSSQQPLQKRLFRLIKSENNVIAGYSGAGRERCHVASQLSEWSSETGDAAVDDLGDKLGVLLNQIGETEEAFAQDLEEYRLTLKHIRNTEKQIGLTREHKQKLTDQIAQLKFKDPESQKLAMLEQELVRAEAENLVAEAQLTNVTRQKLKEAYLINFAAHVERAERQVILAKKGRELLSLLDDTPVIPGDKRPEYDNGAEARAIIARAEDELKEYRLNLEDVPITKLETNLMPVIDGNEDSGSVNVTQDVTSDTASTSGVPQPTQSSTPQQTTDDKAIPTLAS